MSVQIGDIIKSLYGGIIGDIFKLLGGGVIGALLVRYFILRDRRIKKLTMQAVKEEVLSMVPVLIDNKQFPNLIYKEFLLKNDAKHDFDSLRIIFEFDEESEIVSEETISHLGKNRCQKSLLKPNECDYEAQHFNRG